MALCSIRETSKTTPARLSFCLLQTHCASHDRERGRERERKREKEKVNCNIAGLTFMDLIFWGVFFFDTRKFTCTMDFKLNKKFSGIFCSLLLRL